MLLDFLNPLHQIARELTILRELYEADLASRPQPIYRLTEKPSAQDTEVFYAGEKKSPKWKAWLGVGDEVEDEIASPLD